MTDDAPDVRIARLAGTGTALGQLQRGRGEGYLAALDMPRSDATQLVWQCIVRDPRWDQQVEARDNYYAHLVCEIELDVERLAPSSCPSPAPDIDQRLVVGVLAELVALGVDGSGQVLLDHVAHGDQWDDAIYELSRSPGDLYRRLPEVLSARFSETERVAIVHRWRYEIPWEQLTHGNLWVAHAIESFDDTRSSGTVHRDPEPAMNQPASDILSHDWPASVPKRVIHRLSVMLRSGERDELVHALAEPGSKRSVAFRALARLEDAGGLSEAERILMADDSGRDRAAALRYLRELSGEHTLNVARLWIEEVDGRAAAARMIFEGHAEETDVPSLVDGLADAWSAREFYALCSFVDSLARFPGVAPEALIATIYEEAEYSYARRRAARALVAIDRERFSTEYARAGLWDCEAEVQDLAVETIGGEPDPVAQRQIERIGEAALSP